MMHSTHFIYGYLASDIWLRTILIVRKENRCHHIGYSYQLTARVLLYAPSYRQNNTYHCLCYTSCRIDPTTHCTMSEHSYHGATSRSTMKDRSDDPSHHERTLLPRSYISLLPLARRHCRQLRSRYKLYPETHGTLYRG